MAPVPIAFPDVARLHRTSLPIVEVPLGQWQRVSLASFPSVVHFGTGKSYRFDDPEGLFGVLYAGGDYLTCVAESLLRDELRTGSRPLYLDDIQARVIARLAPVVRTVRLVDLTEALGIGLDNQIATHPDYALTQAWSRALHDHPQAPDGLLFVSRNYAKGQAIAIFDRHELKDSIVEAAGSRTALRRHPDYRSLLQMLKKFGIELR
jgi:hypothetical protein